MKTHKTKVGIIGAGPSGLLLSHLLHRQGIANIIIERQSRKHVEGRLRAGLLEEATMDLLTKIGADQNIKQHGLQHEGIILSCNEQRIRIPLYNLTGKKVIIYGQQEMVKDLIAKSTAENYSLFFLAEASRIEFSTTAKSAEIYFDLDGEQQKIECDFIAGCDGFHGISKKNIPQEITTIHEKHYPFSWLGILADAAPATDELIYAWHPRGFAMHSMRSERISRLYLQVPNDEELENWPDHRIWQELNIRLATPGWQLNTGPILEKTITPMRSYMFAPVQYKKLFLAGDAAHIVPPTGAKGLNLAAADAESLFYAFQDFYLNGNSRKLNSYSETVINRAWRVQDFSNLMTELLHLNPNEDEFFQKLQQSKINYLANSEAAQYSLAENYTGKIYRS
ncbi:4-hydroxybenzoate 3-monooxygenase [Pedobacter sp. AW1-32]|uniref:4-hydroxybenzoate 3-monooxygenase n=1 Tax=Pedobacter sp. AW1-32 TaxID=3383026 RepID=UPI003FEFD957